jgi:prevent-host-death family protein
VRELRNHFSWYLKKVRAGEELEVMDRGRVIAKVVPAERREIPAGVAALVREGATTWSGGKPKGATRPLVLPGRSVSNPVTADRR